MRGTFPPDRDGLSIVSELRPYVDGKTVINIRTVVVSAVSLDLPWRGTPMRVKCCDDSPGIGMGYEVHRDIIEAVLGSSCRKGMLFVYPANGTGVNLFTDRPEHPGPTHWTSGLVD